MSTPITEQITAEQTVTEQTTTGQKSAGILVTSFVPWLAHQTSNSSDDLVAALCDRNEFPSNSLWLRHVPVCFESAPALVIGKLHELHPRAIICCGMAETRHRLSIEQQAANKGHVLQTAVNTQALLTKTTQTEISYDAGNYVCNHLYYQVLSAIDKNKLDTVVLFVHVPILNERNIAGITDDFQKILAAL